MTGFGGLYERPDVIEAEERARAAEAADDGRCHVRDSGDGSDVKGECTQPAGHAGVVHREDRGGRLWAEWRSVLPQDECVCHVRPGRCAWHDRASAVPRRP